MNTIQIQIKNINKTSLRNSGQHDEVYALHGLHGAGPLFGDDAVMNCIITSGL